MEVVPTTDGDEDDGVIWFRCPQCQGFLPKLSGAGKDESAAADKGGGASLPDAGATGSSAGQEIPWDSPAEMMADQEAPAETAEPVGPFLPEEGVGTAGNDGKKSTAAPAEPAEPIHEYAALLAETDAAESAPYRPWDSYEVGQCVHHLAWEDCGVVVAKEELPGGRRIIKCYFEDAGVVRLIEQAPR